MNYYTFSDITTTTKTLNNCIMILCDAKWQINVEQVILFICVNPAHPPQESEMRVHLLSLPLLLYAFLEELDQ